MTVPSRLGDVVFQAKVSLLQLRRTTQNVAAPLPRFSFVHDASEFPFPLAEVRTPLWTNGNAGERWLQRGKVQNLRVAARSLNNLVLGAHELFSFWRHAGRATKSRGYAEGRELREGCLIPSVGGGICQLSNALYEAALRSGFTIVERHAHSQIIAGSAAATGRDATVFWNYRDLRFSPDREARLSVRLTADELIVGFWAKNLYDDLPSRPAGDRFLQTKVGGPAREHRPETAAYRVTPKVGRFRLSLLVPEEHSCGTCNTDDCFRHRSGAEERQGVTAFLVDAHSPEMAAYIAARRMEADHLLLPLDGTKWRMARYAWKRADSPAYRWRRAKRSFAPF
jgi:hypothetical protein